MRNGYVWAVLFVTLGYGALGFWDDYLKVTKLNTRGVPGRVKLFVQAVVGFVAAVWITQLARGPLGTALTVPVFKEVAIQLGYFFPVFGTLVMMGASNAVNLTDGLDGLAIVPTMIAAIGIHPDRLPRRQPRLRRLPAAQSGGGRGRTGGVLFGAGRRRHGIPLVQRAAGQGLHGRYRQPSRLGGALGAVAMVTKHEIVLMIVGGLFVVETLSVVIQVFWFKRTGQRVFLMAPLHHHFEKKGWAEPTIVIRFWIISMILALVGLATLKIR